MSKFLGEIINIANQSYRIRITFYNVNSKSPFFVPFSVVNELVIQEDMVNWWTKGWISIQNDFETIERGASLEAKKGKNDQNLLVREGLFKFRHDARNKINVRIATVPSLEEGIELDDNDWTMDFDFIIYDIEDIDTNSVTSKIKKFYFIDERYQIFSERNIPWSTATNKTGLTQVSNEVLNTPIERRTDEQRKMNPNDAIESIIKTASCNNFASENASSLFVGFDESGSIEKPNIPLANINDKRWNKSSSPDSNVFYTSPANSTVMDDLDFMINHAIGKDGDPVFLRFHRFTKKWELVSLVDYFKEAKQIERLLINDGVDGNSAGYISRAPLNANDNKIINFFSTRASIITNYKFAQMSPVDDMRITNRPIHKYDFSTGTYNIFSQENKAMEVYDKIKSFAKTGGLYSHSIEGSDGQIWGNVNKTKSQGLTLENNFYNQGTNSLNLIKMIKDFIFLNQCIYFQNYGLTLRSPGNFIFIDKIDSGDINTFDDRFLGQWLVTKVTHYFSKDAYLTDVYASKIDGINKHWDIQDSEQY